MKPFQNSQGLFFFNSFLSKIALKAWLYLEKKCSATSSFKNF